jgi:hypothetical protein
MRIGPEHRQVVPVGSGGSRRCVEGITRRSDSTVK